MKKLLTILLLVILQSCSTSKFVLKEFKQNPSAYYVDQFYVQDVRIYDEYPDVACQLDKCTKEEFSDRINGYMMFKRSESQIKNPLLKTSVKEIMTTEVKNDLKSGSGKPTILSIKLSCIGYDQGGFMVSIEGEITFHDEVIWKNNGSSLSAYDIDDFYDINWDVEITNGIKNAVKNYISHIPGYKNK